MSPQNPTIKLPAERIAQLKAIAAAHNLPSVAEAVGYLIRNEIKKGTIPAAIPGFDIKAHKGKVSITLDDGHPTLISKDGARKLAKTIVSVLNGEPNLVSIDDGFAIVRQGIGLRISVPITSGGKVVSRDIARDVAAAIERAAK